MKTIFKGAVLTALLAATAGTADAQMTLTGEIRPRTEYRHGYKSLIDSAQSGSVLTSQRSRLNFGYNAENYRVGVSIQDIRVWGSQPQLNTTDGLSSVHEAWGEFNCGKKFSAKIGRQELSYDDHRMLGNVDWVQQGRSHDLALLKYNDSTFTAHAGVAYNQNAEANIGTAYTVANYKEMHFLWLNKKVSAFNISVLVLNNGYQSPVAINATRFSQTAGTRIEYKKNKLFAAINFYDQMGDDNSTGTDGKIRKMNAMLLGADVVYNITEKFSAGAGYEFQTGQSQTDTTRAYRNVNHAFNPFYGTNHKFNGYMDYFYVANHINSVGLQDIYLKLKCKAEKWWIGLDAHMFSAAADVLDVKEKIKSGKYTAMNSSLGTEVDLTYAYTLTNNVTIQLGYSQMLATETMKALKGGKNDLTQNWAYLMLSFKPNFLK